MLFGFSFINFFAQELGWRGSDFYFALIYNFVDEWIGTRLAEIDCGGVDLARDIDNRRITFRAENFFKRGINGNRAMTIFTEHLHRFVSVTLGLRRCAQNRYCLISRLSFRVHASTLVLMATFFQRAPLRRICSPW